MLLERFENFSKKHNMFSVGDSVTAGISGGSDSVCLLHLLISLKEKYGIKIYVAHINHGIRETAQRDEDFVRDLCKKWDIPVYVKKCNVSQEAKKLKISEELCGRNIRYEFFNEIAEKTGSSKILTAHNKNDNAETILLHLLRGSGSLLAIMPCRDNICRPLLEFSKNEIEEYLKSHKINWVEDETNAENIYTRNVLRNEIIPLLKKINPSAEDALIKCSRILKEDDDFISSLAENSGAFSKNEIDTEILKSLPLPVSKRVIIKAIKTFGFELSETSITAVLNLLPKQSGRKYVFPCGGTAIRQYNKIIFEKKSDGFSYSYTICEGEKKYINEIGKYVFLTREKPDREFISISGECTCVTVRNVLKGDSFSPSGMAGTKKVSDLFTDKKIPLSERKNIPILLYNGEIVSVGTLRRSRLFTPEENSSPLYIQITES